MERKPTKNIRDQLTGINPNVQYLNFIKKNHKLVEVLNEQKRQSKQDMNRNRSVFSLSEIKKEKPQKPLTQSVNFPVSTSLRSNFPQSPQSKQIPKGKVFEIIQKKNKEIAQALSKERQSMSDIVYNFNRYKSMESNYYKVDQTKRRLVGRGPPKNLDALKLPMVTRGNEIFTIDYDADGRKMIKVKIQDKNQKIQGSSKPSVREKTKVNELQLHHTETQVHKRHKGNSFGMQIRALPTQQRQLNTQNYEKAIEMRQQIFDMIPPYQSRRRQKIKDIKASYEKKLQQTSQKCLVFEGDFFKKKSFNQIANFVKEYEIVSTQNAYVNGSCRETIIQPTITNQTDSIIPEEEQQEHTQKQKIQKIKEKEKKIVALSIVDKDASIYDIKIKQYRQFLFMVNVAHRKYDPIQLKEAGTIKNQQKYRYYIGKGNNSLLVKSLMKRRFWWVQQDDYKKAHFVWTQLKINQFYQFQRKTEFYQYQCKVQEPDQVQIAQNSRKKYIKKLEQNKKNMYKAPLPIGKDKLFTNYDCKHYELFEQSLTNQNFQKLQKFSNRLKYFPQNFLLPRFQNRQDERVHNHFESNFYIGNKKALFYNLRAYYELLGKNVFEIIPLTFHIKNGMADPEYAKFLKEFKKLQSKKQKCKDQQKEKQKDKKLRNIWIVKPGELSNRGNGITVIDQIYQLTNIFKKKEKHTDGSLKTYIIQKYIQKPLLYKGRKFDIRHYLLISRLHGLMRAYWFGEGYIRTSSIQYDLDDVGNEMVHLTNDAVQKYSQGYGKYEQGNKLSYNDLQKYMQGKLGEGKWNFSQLIYPKMKRIATDAIKATYLQLDTNRCEHNFEVFGLDFMIDKNNDVWLIEVNTNPCLQLSSKLLSRIIPTMLEQSFRLTIDPLFPPPSHYPNSQKYLAPDDPLGRLQFQLIFDEARDGKTLVELFKNVKNTLIGEVQQDQQVYQNQGKEIELNADLEE